MRTGQLWSSLLIQKHPCTLECWGEQPGPERELELARRGQAVTTVTFLSLDLGQEVEELEVSHSRAGTLNCKA